MQSQNRVNQRLNEIILKNDILTHELKYRYELDSIILICYAISVVLLESIIDQYRVPVGVIIYFFIEDRSKSLAITYADTTDDITYCRFLHFFGIIFRGVIRIVVFFSFIGVFVFFSLFFYFMYF